MQSDNATITLGEFFGKGKTFVIPDYQRGYVWGKSRGTEKNSVQFALESLMKCINDDSDLFMQGITVTETDDQIILIDGQQRTTFFYLLLTYLGKHDIKIDYSVRLESGAFLKEVQHKTGDEILAACQENLDEEFQDVYFFKKTIREIEKSGIALIENATKKILDHVKFLYIDIPESKAKTVFKMMNGNKAKMQTAEIVKAEMLRLVSVDKDFDPGKMSGNNLLECLFGKVKEVEAAHWEQNLLRSKYAREWDKWLYWWRRPEVQKFYGNSEKDPIGLLLEIFFKADEARTKKEFNFENFRDSVFYKSQEPIEKTGQDYSNREQNAKNAFYNLRRFQKKFEDAFNDYESYNKIGAILTLLKKPNEKNKFLVWYLSSNDKPDIDNYYKYVFLLLESHERTLKAIDGTEDDINSAQKALIDALESDNLYIEKSELAFAQLLRRNIQEDNKLKRKFNFDIWKEKSLEHIYPKSKFYKIVNEGEDDEKLIRGDGLVFFLRKDGEKKSYYSKDKKKEILFEMKDPSVRGERLFNGNGSEHCIGNLVLLYKNENSVFSNKLFKEKRDYLFRMNCGKETETFRSKHLLHTVSVFASESWDVEEIQNNKKEFIEEVKKYYGIQ